MKRMGRNSSRKGEPIGAHNKATKPAADNSPAPTPRAARSSPQDPPIVGIGAFAAHLDDILHLLRCLPCHTGMAFVLLLNSESNDEGLQMKLLAGATEMPVAQLDERKRAQPNHVYVARLKSNLKVTRGFLQVVKSKGLPGRHFPVDYFFRSLAESQRSQSIGVLMSGLAADGITGLRAIKAAGGITFVQGEVITRLDATARNLTAESWADFVLPPEEIAAELQRIARHPLAFQTTAKSALPAKAEDWPLLFRRLRAGSGVDFSGYSKSWIERHVSRRMAVLNFEVLSDYLKYLEENRRESDVLFRDMVFQVAGFFRDTQLFATLQDKLFPEILAERRPGDSVRLWVPGCATGEEAYSMLFCLLEYLGDRAEDLRIQVFATDVDDSAIEKARAAVYSEEELDGVSVERRRRFFSRIGDQYSVKPDIRKLCVFGRHDITRDAPISKLDVVNCRNILINFETPLQNKVLASLHFALMPGGVLLLPRAEDIGGFGNFFTNVDRNNNIFMKSASHMTGAHYFARRILADYDLETLELEGGTKQFASPSPIRFSVGQFERLEKDLASTREQLQAAIRKEEQSNDELTAANEEAISTMEELQSTNEELLTAKEELQWSNDELVTVNKQLEERNLKLTQLSDDLNNLINRVDIAIVILDAERRIRRCTPPAEMLLGIVPADIGRPISDLRIGVNVPDLDDLISSIIENGGGEITREVQSDNGRWYWLRICPFQTAAQKIDGVLIAFLDINVLKQSKALQEERDFVSAILDAAGDLLVMVLDREGRIVQFNQVCQRVSGYRAEEISGRHPWDLLVPPQESEAVEKTFKEAMGGAAVKTESHWIAKDGRQLLIGWSISPAMMGASIGCVIMSGVDQTERAEARQRADQSQATVRALLETAAQAILAINRQGLIVLANEATEKIFGYNREELLNRCFEKLIPERLRERHADQVGRWFSHPANRQMGMGLELVGLRKNGTEFPVDVSLSYLEADGGLAVAFVSDITERKKNEQALLDYQRQLQKLTANLISVQESGNQNLARELHDVFSQELAALTMELSTLQPSGKAAGQLGERLTELGRKIGHLAEQMHDTARRLHPRILHELGLETALREQCGSFSQQTGIPTRFVYENVPASLPENVSLCLYRVAQESLLNIRKHAGPTKVWLQLRGNGGIRMIIGDTGDGFAVDEAWRTGGLGLISMEERVRLVGGKFDIRSKPGLGTTVEVFVPLADLTI